MAKTNQAKSNAAYVKEKRLKQDSANGSSTQDVKQDSTTTKVANFLWIGIVLTIIDYLVYELVLFTIFQGNTEMVGLSSTISALVATIAAYILHTHITWRTRDPGRFGIIKFFLWNLLLAIAIRPFLAWTMGLLDIVYQAAFDLSQWLNLPLSKEYITSTGIFAFITVITMILNYFVYDALIFGKAKQVDTRSQKRSSSSKKQEKAS